MVWSQIRKNEKEGCSTGAGRADARLWEEKARCGGDFADRVPRSLDASYI
jgi:hypothetical protein